MFSTETKWVRVFDVPEIAKHTKGFTVYKIVSLLYPESCHDAVTKITAWKRFNDFKSLHKSINTLQKSLKIHDKLPTLPQAAYFKRFDEDVIQKRKLFILTFLGHISANAQLFTSNMFVKFFETSHNPNELEHGDSDDECTISDDTDVLSTVSSSMTFQLTDDSSPISFKVSISDLQLYSCELFGNALEEDDLIDGTYVSYADRFFELATETEATYREFKIAWKHYMQGIYVLLTHAKDDKQLDRKDNARFALEKYFLRVEKLFHLHLYHDVHAYLSTHYGEEFAVIALYDVHNVHIQQLFDFEKFEAIPPCEHDTELMFKFDIGHVNLGYYPITVPYDCDDFEILANKYENEQNYAAAYVNYKLAFADMYKCVRSERKDLPRLYREHELLTSIDKEKTEATALKEKHSDLYKYKVIELIDDGAMIIRSVENQQTYLLKAVQKAFTFSSDTLVLPKHVPYMTKLLRWFNTEDAIFMLFCHTNAMSLKHYILTYTDTFATNCTKNSEESKEPDSPSAEFEFLDLPLLTNSSSVEDLDEFEEFSAPQVPVDKVRTWIAQVVLAIERLHRCGIYCCNITIDNLKIDENCNILIDYVFKMGEPVVACYKECSALAPEIYSFEMITPSADWWALGMLIYELFVGMPLYSMNANGFVTYPFIKLPNYLSQDIKSLIKQLLILEPNIRLGAGGVDQVKSHPFFNTIKWNAL